MRKMVVAAALGLGLVLGGPAHMALGTGSAAAQGRGGFHGGGGGGFRGGGGGFHGGGFGGGSFGGHGFGEHFGGFQGGFGGRHDGGYGYRGGWGGYRGYGFGHGGFGYGGFGYGCCGYYGGYYDGAGVLLGAAAIAGVTALAVDSAYDRSYDRGYYDGNDSAPVRYVEPLAIDRRSLIDRCARAAENHARGWSSYARFARTESFDRDGPTARVDGVLDVATVGYRGRYDSDGFPLGNDQRTTVPVRFSCSLDGGQIVDLRLDRPGNS